MYGRGAWLYAQLEREMAHERKAARALAEFEAMRAEAYKYNFQSKKWNWEGQPSFFHDGAQVLPDDHILICCMTVVVVFCSTIFIWAFPA